MKNKNLIKEMMENIRKESSTLHDMEDYVLTFIDEVEKSLYNPLETIIYKEDFLLNNSWQAYCDECEVPRNSDEIVLQFNSSNVVTYKNGNTVTDNSKDIKNWFKKLDLVLNNKPIEDIQRTINTLQKFNNSHQEFLEKWLNGDINDVLKFIKVYPYSSFHELYYNSSNWTNHTIKNLKNHLENKIEDIEIVIYESEHELNDYYDQWYICFNKISLHLKEGVLIESCGGYVTVVEDNQLQISIDDVEGYGYELCSLLKKEETQLYRQIEDYIKSITDNTFKCKKS